MNHTDAPLISIIVAVFNGRATLQQCIDSVAQQTYSNRELIIIDGASRDGTVELLDANRDRITYWISEPDRGVYNAWNKGLAQVKGEWVCFLGADDYFWDNKVLERMAPQLQMLPPDIRVAYGEIMQIGDGGELPRPMGEAWEQVKEPFRQYMCIPHVGTMHRSGLFGLRGKFDESFRIAGDYELLLRELKTGDAAFMPGIITVGQRLGGISTDTRNRFKVLQEVWRAQRMHGQLLPGRFLSSEMFMEYIRMLFGARFARQLQELHRRIRGMPLH